MPGIKHFDAVLLALAVCATASGQDAVKLSAGMAAFNTGHYSQALPLLQDAAQNSSDQRARVFLGLTQAALNNCKDALPILSAQIQGSDATLERLAGIGAVKCYEATGDVANALQFAHRLEAKYPDDADVLYLTAKLHMQA